MSPFDDGPLDEVDRGILQLLQRNARHTCIVDIAEQLPVSEGTVRNRLEKMERDGIVRGYVPIIDYEAAGAQLRVQFTCTAPVDTRTALVEEAIGVDGVVDVREFTSPVENVQVGAVADGTDGITRISQRLTDIGLTVESDSLLVRDTSQPFDDFGTSAVAKREPSPPKTE